MMAMPSYAGMNDKAYKEEKSCMSSTAGVVVNLYKKKGTQSRKWSVSTGKSGAFGGTNHKWKIQDVSYQDAVAKWNRFVKKKMKKASADMEYCLKIVK